MGDLGPREGHEASDCSPGDPYRSQGLEHRMANRRERSTNRMGGVSRRVTTLEPYPQRIDDWRTS